MSIVRSDNCAAYTDTISLLVTGEAHVPGRDATCSVPLPATFSCQTSAFEAPDATTRAGMEAAAIEALTSLGCDADAATVSFQTSLVGSQSVEYDAEKLAKLGMASNCYREGNDPNHATHRAEAVCKPMFDMTDADGNRVRDYHRTFLSSLATCDASDEGMPQLMEDLRKVAALNGQRNGFTVDRSEDLACKFSVLPTL